MQYEWQTMTHLKGVLHVVHERIHGVVGKDELILEQLEVLGVHQVVDACRLEGVERHEDTLRRL